MRLRLLFILSIALVGISCGQGTQSVREQPAPAARPAAAPPVTAGDTTPRGIIPPWNFMSLSTAGVDSFLLRQPTYDGRGVVILIFDTGTDMSIPGLLRTSTGAPKVIDFHDFTGSNILAFQKGTVSAGRVSAPGGLPRLSGLESLSPAPLPGSDLYLGVMEESRFRNSTIRDFDGDGISRSRFGALLYRSAEGWRVVVDTDADSSLAGEHPIGHYPATLETVQFKQKSTDTKPPLTMAARIDSASHTVAFVYDMNGHGTHVGGIAAGFAINGEPGFNGIAPGAQLIAGKIASDLAKDNTVTGSMRRAYDYAASLADSLQRHHTPVVVNMSFGIGSSLEGRAAIESYLNDLLPRHPNLYVVTSAGNEGPGISTIGIPAAASRLITVGALLPRGIGHDSYAAELDRDILWDFTSRGGEVDKPDVVAPGTAVSTIARFAFDARASGTSMASPYTAGVVALLLSAMRQEDSTWVPGQELMRRALRYSARNLPYYSALEQGGGVVDVGRAYRLLKSYRRSGYANDIVAYDISTFSPNYPDERGSTAFWRSGYVPDEDWRQSFTISRASETSADFFRAFTLESTAPWLKTVQSTVYLRNNASAQVDVLYDREKMREPGIYSARVVARRASNRESASEEVEFELLNTVIVPWRFSPENDYTVSIPTRHLEAGLTQRFYFAVPPGASALEFTLGVPKGSRSNVGGTIIDRNGYKAGYLPRVRGSERDRATSLVASSTLGDGVIEVVVHSDVFEGGGGASDFSLDVRAVMVDITPEVIARAKGRTLDLSIINGGSRMIEGSFTQTVKGYGRTVRDTMKADTFSMPLVIRKGDGALWISPSFTPEGYLHATDITARIVDAEGNVQADESFNQPSVWLFLPNFERTADSTKFRLEIIYGDAGGGAFPKLPISIVENHVRPSEPSPLGGYGGFTLVPFVPRHAMATMPDFDIPAGYHGLGEITFKERGAEQTITWDFPIPR